MGNLITSNLQLRLCKHPSQRLGLHLQRSRHLFYFCAWSVASPATWFLRIAGYSICLLLDFLLPNYCDFSLRLLSSKLKDEKSGLKGGTRPYGSIGLRLTLLPSINRNLSYAVKITQSLARVFLKQSPQQTFDLLRQQDVVWKGKFLVKAAFFLVAKFVVSNGMPRTIS